WMTHVLAYPVHRRSDVPAHRPGDFFEPRTRPTSVANPARRDIRAVQDGLRLGAQSDHRVCLRAIDSRDRHVAHEPVEFNAEPATGVCAQVARLDRTLNHGAYVDLPSIASQDDWRTR